MTSLAEQAKLLALDLRNWAKDPPLHLNTEEQIKIADLLEALALENSQLHVRDSNVTFHSKNVMGINEDLQAKLKERAEHVIAQGLFEYIQSEEFAQDVAGHVVSQQIAHATGRSPKFVRVNERALPIYRTAICKALEKAKSKIL